jgi:endonuclease-8
VPEGDSLHRIARRLQVLVGHRIEAESPNPRGLVTGVARAVDGLRLERVDAVGKNVVLGFEGGVVVRSHLRMNGRWRVEPRAEARTVGSPWLVLRGGDWQATQWNGPILTLDPSALHALGPDLLADDLELDSLLERLRAADQGRLVGEVLLDQRLVAGIGNMWLAEMLWQAKISPWSRIGDVADADLEHGLRWARGAMRASVEGRRPTRSVYRRSSRACRRCGESIRSRGLGETNRTAYWCPRCQPAEVL